MIILASAFLWAFFSNPTPLEILPPPVPSFLASRVDGYLQNHLAKAREMVSVIPVVHSQEIRPYTETMVTDGGSYTRKRSDYAWRTIPLALLNPSTGEIRTTLITRTIRNGTLPTLLTSNDGQFLIAVETRAYGTVWNWWNTGFTVLSPNGWIVVAINWEREPSRENYIYTPFSRDLITAFPSLVRIGRSHVEDDVDAALALLEHVPSRAWPGNSARAMIETYLPDLPFAIISVEQADAHEVAVARAGGVSFNPLDRAYTIFGGNGDTSFGATRSPVGARGLMQVMPETCEQTRRLYPSAQIPDGCMQYPHGHVTELVTGMLVVDDHLATVIASVRKRGISAEDVLRRPDLPFLVLISYNSGPGRSIKAVRGSNDIRASIPQETRGYLKKYDAWSWKKR